ncbi:MAG: 8-oxo-dGTP diphosphatase [Chitinivibrionia bacterium]|nr:8-oxo-dGTP diphosphatase [Chitinivibrionia bacterium]
MEIKKVKDFHWENDKFSEYAVLSFVFNKERDEVLLIHKKRGLGKGKINAPGGRIEPNESDFEAAIRETQEEVCLTPKELKKVGELNFYFTDGYSLKGFVFVSQKYVGEIKETDEAKPFWCKMSQIPYKNMWADDIFWLPLMLSGEKFRGYFVFEKDKMLDKNIIIGKDLSFEYNKNWHNSAR